MKKMKKFLPLISLAALMACSSMDVSEDEAVAENYPDDFDVTVYMELHPELRSLQIQDYVSTYNSALTSGLGTEDKAAYITEDTTAFLADTAQLHVIFTTPEYAGYSEDIWEEDWMSISITVVDTVLTPTEFDTIYVKLDSINAETEETTVLTVYYPEFNLDEETNSKGTVSGYSDSAMTEAVSYDVDSVSIILLWKYAKFDTLAYDTTITESVEVTEGGLTTAHKTLLKKFSFYDTTDDLTALEAVPWDTAAFSYQFIAFGASHGWAYRYCTDEEANNTIRGSDVYPASKYYCEDDDGVVREITE